MKKAAILLTLLLLFKVPFSQTKPVLEWANIPAGSFNMGSMASEMDRDLNENPHRVTLSAFRISKKEITVRQFKAFVDATGRNKLVTGKQGMSKPTNVNNGEWMSFDEFLKDASTKVSADGTIEISVPAQSVSASSPEDRWLRDESGILRADSAYDFPVINVSWDDAKAFAEWMGGRLPTEAEWEYACRAGTVTPFNKGKNLFTSQSNYNGKYPYGENPEGEFRSKITKSGSFPANTWGVYDMHGNVWEWCSDWLNDYSFHSLVNPKGPESGSERVVRGGSFQSAAKDCRCATRYSKNPEYFSVDVGFRIVKDVNVNK